MKNTYWTTAIHFVTSSVPLNCLCEGKALNKERICSEHFFKGASQFLKSDITLQGEFPFDCSLKKPSYRKYLVQSKTELLFHFSKVWVKQKTISLQSSCCVWYLQVPPLVMLEVPRAKSLLQIAPISMDIDQGPGDENTAWSSPHLMGNCNYCKVRESDISNVVSVLLIQLLPEGFPY